MWTGRFARQSMRAVPELGAGQLLMERARPIELHRADQAPNPVYDGCESRSNPLVYEKKAETSIHGTSIVERARHYRRRIHERGGSRG